MAKGRSFIVRKDPPRLLLLELAAQGLLLVLALGAVLAFGLPEQQTMAVELVVLILVLVMVIPALYGGFVIARALRRR